MKRIIMSTVLISIFCICFGSDGTKYIGTWYSKNYDGENNKTKITITKLDNNYLVKYEKMERGGGFDLLYNTDGSFKAVGQLIDNLIIINSDIKLALIDNNTLLINNMEFIKSNGSVIFNINI